MALPLVRRLGRRLLGGPLDAWKQRLSFARSMDAPWLNQALHVRASRCRGLRLNLLLPSLAQERVFGGIATALEFFRSLSSEFDDATPLRIITFDPTGSRRDRSAGARHGYERTTGEADDAGPRQHLDFSYRSIGPLAIGPNDVFVATYWLTALIGERLVLEQNRLFPGNGTRSLLYLIQDFEPGFYPWSTEYALALSTYSESRVPRTAIFNTALLREYFRREGIRMSREYVLEPPMNARLAGLRAGLARVPKRQRILVYGRPSVPRNAFGLIVHGLRTWIQRYDCRGWELASAGEAHPVVDLGRGFHLESLGKLSLEQYAQTLAESAIGLVLMISPHPSYPPLEMAGYGVITITNDFGPKSLGDYHENIVSLRAYGADDLAEAIEAACRRFLADRTAGARGRPRVAGLSEENAAFGFVRDLAANICAEVNLR